jgi:alkylation response protein AidB-like acyl-CoA dehydrogenase
VRAEAVALDEGSVLRFDGDPVAAVGRLLDRAAVAVACDSLGLSEAMLAATVAHARSREQFGRPIGSFQAVKHACADMLVQVSVSRQLVAQAVRRIAEDHVEAGVAASMAKSYACAAAVDVVGKAMQLHGGLGYTWDSGIHVYLKRAALNRSLFGSPAAHRRRLARRYL